jgi:hypothetical protein
VLIARVARPADRNAMGDSKALYSQQEHLQARSPPPTLTRAAHCKSALPRPGKRACRGTFLQVGWSLRRALVQVLV